MYLNIFPSVCASLSCDAHSLSPITRTFNVGSNAFSIIFSNFTGANAFYLVMRSLNAKFMLFIMEEIIKSRYLYKYVFYECLVLEFLPYGEAIVTKSIKPPHFHSLFWNCAHCHSIFQKLCCVCIYFVVICQGGCSKEAISILQRPSKGNENHNTNERCQ